MEASCRAALARLDLPPHIRVSTDSLSQLPPVQAGREQLGLVFSNLVENACDALGDREGQVTIRGRRVSDANRALVVEDDPRWQSLVSEVLTEAGCAVTAVSQAPAVASGYQLAVLDMALDPAARGSRLARSACPG